MKRQRLSGDDAKADSPINFIFDNALGVPIELTAAPTTIGNELPSNSDFGFFGNDLYINLNGTTVKFTGAAV